MHLHHRNSSCATNRHCLLSVYNLLTLLCVIMLMLATVAAAGRVPQRVEVNKCCRLGEQLNEKQECIVGDNDHWWPLIFLINKHKPFDPKGDAPRFFHTREHKMPMCELPELIISQVAIFSNGSLFLSERNTIVELENYCVDKNAAIVCLQRPQGADSLRAPIKLTKVYKCCGGRSVYNTGANTCVAVDDGHAALSTKLINNSTTIEYLFGFPTCSGTSHYTIADKFDEKQLNLDNGSLTIKSGQQLEWNEFCLEHTVNDVDEPFVNVFTCSENLVSAEHQPVPKQVN